MKYIVTHEAGLQVKPPYAPWKAEDEPRKKTRRPPESLSVRVLQCGEQFEAVPYSNEGGIETVRLADFKGQAMLADIVRGRVIYARLVAAVAIPSTAGDGQTLEERVKALEDWRAAQTVSV